LNDTRRALDYRWRDLLAGCSLVLQAN